MFFLLWKEYILQLYRPYSPQLDWVAPPILPAIEFALHKGLEKSGTFLSGLDPFLLEPITKLAFPPGVLLAGLTQ